MYKQDLEKACKDRNISVVKTFVRSDDACSNCLFVVPSQKKVYLYHKTGRTELSWG